MGWNRQVAVAGILALLVSCDQESRVLHERDTLLSENLLAKNPFDQRMADIMAHADRVEACRLDEVRVPAPPANKDEALPALGTISWVPGKASVVERGVANELSAVLVDQSTYALGTVLCFQPGVQFDFIGRGGHVVVRVCFHCQNLAVTATDAEGKEWGSGGTFSPGYGKLVALAKKIFPDDAEIQALNESDGFNLPN